MNSFKGKNIQLSLLAFFAMVIFSIISSCKLNSEKDVYEVKIQRFEQELFDSSKGLDAQHFINLSNKYGLFYKSFCTDLINIPHEEERDLFRSSLLSFINYPTIKQLKHEVDSVFPDLGEEENKLKEAMEIYYDKFPKADRIKFVSFLSEFGYAHVTYDSIIGIGLDMYLGEKYALYPALEFPEFMYLKLRREYMVPNTIKALAIGKYEAQLTDKRFLAMMLFEGKVKYFTKQLLPDIADTLIFGCTQKQMSWLKENEAMIWAHFIQEKLLFSQEVPKYMRYFNDGPFTSAPGVPAESAPAIGIYAGYKIIENYMNHASSESLEELMKNKNWDEILKISKYRP
ncbi:MAG: hypothetical protein ACOVP1_01475 [Bacteroidia bacterium]